MTESSQMLRQKASELETAVSEGHRELERSDATRQTETHHRLAEVLREARDWLDGHGKAPDEEGDAATAEARRAESLLHEIRMRRTEL